MRHKHRKAGHIVREDPTSRLVDAVRAARDRFEGALEDEGPEQQAMSRAIDALMANTPTTDAGLLAFVQCMRENWDPDEVFDVIERALRGMIG